MTGGSAGLFEHIEKKGEGLQHIESLEMVQTAAGSEAEAIRDSLDDCEALISKGRFREAYSVAEGLTERAILLTAVTRRGMVLNTDTEGGEDGQTDRKPQEGIKEYRDPQPGGAGRSHPNASAPEPLHNDR